MNREEVIQKTRAFLGRFVRQEISDDVGLFETGLVNSMFAMQLVIFIETDFMVEVGDDDLELANFRSIKAIADFVMGKHCAGA